MWPEFHLEIAFWGVLVVIWAWLKGLVARSRDIKRMDGWVQLCFVDVGSASSPEGAPKLSSSFQKASARRARRYMLFEERERRIISMDSSQW